MIILIETFSCGNFKAYGVRAEREALEKRTNRRAVIYRCFRNYLLLKLQIAGSFVRQFFTGATCSRTLAQHDTGSILITFYQHSSSSISQIFNIQSHTSVYRCFELILYWLLVAAAQSRSRVWYRTNSAGRLSSLSSSLLLRRRACPFVCANIDVLFAEYSLRAPAVSTTDHSDLSLSRHRRTDVDRTWEC